MQGCQSVLRLSFTVDSILKSYAEILCPFVLTLYFASEQFVSALDATKNMKSFCRQSRRRAIVFQYRRCCGLRRAHDCANLLRLRIGMLSLMSLSGRPGEKNWRKFPCLDFIAVFRVFVLLKFAGISTTSIQVSFLASTFEEKDTDIEQSLIHSLPYAELLQ